jgi:uncharacterized protein (DUF1697 family)
LNDPSLNRFVAFLGSINVGGHRATADQLRAALEALGHRRVETFLASGNLIFDPPDRPAPEALSAELAAALTEALGFGVPVYLRAADEVRAIALERPFSPAELEASGGKHQVILLGATPSATIREQALELASAEDRLAFGDRELHWLPSAGVSGSDLDLKALAALLGPSTVRTLNTIGRITDRFLS